MNGIQVQTSPTVPVLPLLVKERVGVRLLALLFILFFIACTPEDPADTDSDNTGSDVDPNDQINFLDPVLRACVEDLTGKNPGDPIYGYDVADIISVDCSGVSDLTGIEYFLSVETLTFRNSLINSINKLNKLINVKELRIRGGSITSIDAVVNMKQIERIDIMETTLKEINALSNKQNLTNILLGSNTIENASVLSTLPKVQYLELQDNPGLYTLGGQFVASQLISLNVGNCALTSLSELSGLPELKTISASNNYLTEVSFITTLPKLENIGISGNCLSESAMQTYVDWYNAYHETQKTVEEEMQYQDAGKCQ